MSFLFLLLLFLLVVVPLELLAQATATARVSVEIVHADTVIWPGDGGAPNIPTGAQLLATDAGRFIVYE